MMENNINPNNKTDNPIGVTTLKLKVLQIAAQELLDTWKVNGDACEFARLNQAIGRLSDAMNKTKVGGSREEGRSLHA